MEEATWETKAYMKEIRWQCELDSSVSGRVQWQAIVNMVMNFWVPWKVEISWLAELLSASQEGLYSI